MEKVDIVYAVNKWLESRTLTPTEREAVKKIVEVSHG